MKRYNLINNILGWVCFVVAAVTYLLTVEPTASFWDCPEFIVQGSKLEVGHPPGNPIFMLTARFFVTIFGGGMDTAALAVNVMSALLSAATILLMFWTITHFASRLLFPVSSKERGAFGTFLCMAAGVCGALAYTWSDTFWFSAVEGEVYAFSSFCTALVVWLMLKWESRADQPYSDRWLILIAYVIGVSIGVHLLNLLCIPALGLIFYFRKTQNVNLKGALIALAVSVVLVGAILYGLVPGIVQMAQWFELLFVNNLGLSYNQGVIIYALVLVAVFAIAIYKLYTSKKYAGAKIWSLMAIVLSGMPFIGHSVLIGVVITLVLGAILVFAVIPRRVIANIVISVFVIFVGYSSYGLLLIRASANTPMSQNAPDNVFALSSYLNREQYGERPLFYGPTFAEQIEDFEYPEGSGVYYVRMDERGLPSLRTVDGYLRDEYGNPFNTPQSIYSKVAKNSPDEPDRYVAMTQRPDYRTMPDLNMLLTRMYSPDHVANYKGWSGYRISDFDKIPTAVRDQWAANGFATRAEVMRYLPDATLLTTNVFADNDDPAVQVLGYKPSFGDNISYFINYQLNHMYWRYFMWNFAGRQNDFQGNGEPHLGNWISGIPFIDNARLGDQSALPDEFGKGNKGHNVFYMLPLLLGLIGILGQALYRKWASEEVGIEQFWVVFFLFFMTGIAIVLYLNQTPAQPRERDYAFAGSFYAFAIWIGLAIPAIGIWVKKLLDRSKAATPVAVAVTAVIALGVPVQMVSQTWDDHDRPGRYTTRDFGFNYLASVDPDGIIFTNGDNDTFPLWYAQEVEGFRTDVRVVNLSYLTTDWYADQMRHPVYNAAGIPMFANPRYWAYDSLAYSFVVNRNPNPVDVRLALDSLYNYDGSRFGAKILTSPRMFIPVDLDAAMRHYATGIPETDSLIAASVTDIPVSFAGASGINLSKTLSLDMIANNVLSGFSRPTYFASTVPTSYYLGLDNYLSPTGVAYEVTPVPTSGEYNITAQKGFRNIVGSYRWGGLDQPGAEGLYLDETVRRMVSSFRSAMLNIAENLLRAPSAAPDAETVRFYAERGGTAPATQADMARIILNMIEEKLPGSVTPYDSLHALYMAQDYLRLYAVTGNADDLRRASELADGEVDRYGSLVKYATTLSARDVAALGRSEGYALNYLPIALGVKNITDILSSGEQSADISLLEELMPQLDITDLYTVGPYLYIYGADNELLASEADRYADEEYIFRLGMAINKASAEIGRTAPSYGDSVMARFNFTPAQWASVLRR